MFRLDWCRAVLTLIKSRSHVDKHAIQTHTLWIKKFSVVHQIASSCCCCFNYTVHPRISIMTKWTLKWFENRNLKKDKFTLKQKYTGKKKIKTLKWYYITSIIFFFYLTLKDVLKYVLIKATNNLTNLTTENRASLLRQLS